MNKYTDYEIGQIVENEGLEYAVLHYMSAENCQNPETEKLWREAEEAMKHLEEHVFGVNK